MLVLWVALVGIGMTSLARYQNRPGTHGASIVRWPTSTTSVHPLIGKPVLLIFAHPECPCSEATLAELAKIMGRYSSVVDTHVLFFHPTNKGEQWENTSLVQTAKEIPGVKVQLDDDGREANRFHAETSGHAMLFDAGGNLVFSGGITGSRGHEGDNAGRDAVESWLAGHKGSLSASPVFGCSLKEP